MDRVTVPTKSTILINLDSGVCIGLQRDILSEIYDALVFDPKLVELRREKLARYRITDVNVEQHEDNAAKLLVTREPAASSFATRLTAELTEKVFRASLFDDAWAPLRDKLGVVQPATVAEETAQ